ncbi:hypothetical protein HHK36_016310 [Tetracentron sinense]|uniref:Uncharacterized protein n=1 Tax=Tetracentron sinense TaxID=13715 RepID=A0A835DE36_TETSI|nr:hypothetical protein HHK36_016310 [Tetracentron sinense]
MANVSRSSFPVILSILMATIIVTSSGVFGEDRQVYIVYMGALPAEGEYSPSSHHHSILQQVLEGSSMTESLVRSYKRSFNGFAAKLTDQEKQRLSNMEGIVSVFPSRTLKLHTTRSWDFMGFPETVKRNPTVESDTIVGVIDTGIWPESKCFSDEGFSPPPKKWKGSCQGGRNFTCNNKIIGARFYSFYEHEDSARDTNGHGTHTASIAAGNKVKDASFYGLARGIARGAVPSARIAVYKVCSDKCSEVDILSAFDDAISDGVDILSVSLGGYEAKEYHTDSIAIGSFHAFRRGILTSTSAGNGGPDESSVVNVAPWMLTVAASSTDRRIIDNVILGDGTTLMGRAVNAFDMKGKKFPLIYGGKASSSNHKDSTRFCLKGSLDENLVQGKIVYCDSYSTGELTLHAKAIGTIMGDDRFSDFALSYPLPVSLLSVHDGERVKSYINSAKNPEANIMRSDVLRDANAPVIVSFSSRGPNPMTTDIIKASIYLDISCLSPDISAPGVEILAAWSPVGSPTNVSADTRSVKFNIFSGTSVACPHATGAAAYVKTFHPDWSPAAIKSALMTTASPMNADTKFQDREFAYGSGHIDPVKAVNPGLVYDTSGGDYLEIQCHNGYTTKEIRLIAGDNSSCPKRELTRATKDLNYPSMATDVRKSNFTRTVTNVGFPNSTYTATVTSHSKIKITVSPDVLSFKTLKEKQSFVVTVSTEEKYDIISASLVWFDGVHSVRSPIVLYYGS